MPSGSLTGNFAIFSREALKSVVETVNARRRRGRRLSLAAGTGVFAVLALAVYLFFLPYSGLMDEHDISYWPLLFLAPASLGLIAFCLVYILTLRSAVKEFRERLVGEMAAFIDAGIVHETERPLPKAELEEDVLSVLGGAPAPGADLFRGRVPGAAVLFSDIRLKREPGADGKPELLTGLYFHAAMDRNFAMPLLVFPSSVEVSRGDFESKLRAAGDNVGTGLLRLDDTALGRQILVPSGGEDFVLAMLASPEFAKLEAFRSQTNGSLCLSFRGNAMRIAILSRSGRMDLPGMLDEFDFAHCREFCRAAKLCLEMARGMAERKDVWREEKTATGL